jgi:hypothetical protein
LIEHCAQWVAVIGSVLLVAVVVGVLVLLV